MYYCHGHICLFLGCTFSWRGLNIRIGPEITLKTSDFTDPVSGGLSPNSPPPEYTPSLLQNSEKSFSKKKEEGGGIQNYKSTYLYVLTFCNICGYIRETELFSRICNSLIFILDSSWLKGLVKQNFYRFQIQLMH